MKKFFLILLFNSTLLIFNCQAQCDSIASFCAKHIEPPFISDGQQYRALLLADQTAEFHTTFYGGATYRIAAVSGLKDGNLVFSVYDGERNLLYSNKEFRNAPYWDFKAETTLDVIIEANLGGSAASGCAVVLVGFKQ